MTAPSRSALGLTRTEHRGQTTWTLVGEGALPTDRADQITTGALDVMPVEQAAVTEHVDAVMAALQTGRDTITTPGGAAWLHVEHVPVRRLVTRLVRKLLALNSWGPFAQAPGPLTVAPYEGLIGVRDTASREYRHYTVTWSAVAHVLGAPAPHNPMYSARLRGLIAKQPEATSETAPPTPLSWTDVVAFSWSTRHWQTLLPVLEQLASTGERCVLVDMATDTSERCTGRPPVGVRVLAGPTELICVPGSARDSWSDSAASGTVDGTVQIGHHSLRIDRVRQLAFALTDLAGGCTQPSWNAVLRVEQWLDALFTQAQPHTVLVSNDTSPLGALTVHAAERHGANTVHIQHGAWTAETVAWSALHSRHLVVMGERDAELARSWAHRPETEIHVLGQPRFDVLVHLQRGTQRRYLDRLFTRRGERAPDRVLVWACQPFGAPRLRAHADLLMEGLRKAEERWGLVIAPHPAQEDHVFESLRRACAGVPVALADQHVGARGCLAGADALASAYSTCGIEAALLYVPVLELAPADGRTLGLAEQRLARRCGSPDDVTDALNTTRDQPRPPRQHLDAVCRWRGTSSADIAQLINACTAKPAEGRHRGAPRASTDEGVPEQ